MDDAQCQSRGQNNGGQAGEQTGEQSFTKMVVDATMTDDGSGDPPMIAKGHVDLGSNGGQGPDRVYWHLTVTDSPTEAPPNGAMLMDYTLTMMYNGQETKIGRGRLETSASQISWSQRQMDGPSSSYDERLIFSESGGVGSGALEGRTWDENGPSMVTMTVGAKTSDDTDMFCRSMDGTESCFDMRMSQADFSVWRCAELGLGPTTSGPFCCC